MNENLRYGDKVKLLTTIEFYGGVTVAEGTALKVDHRMGDTGMVACQTEPPLWGALLMVPGDALELIEKFQPKTKIDAKRLGNGREPMLGSKTK